MLLVFSCNSENKQNQTNAQSTAGNTSPMSFRLEPVAENVTAPVAFAHANDGSDRLFIVEQPGRILIVKNGRLQNDPFLDISSQLVPLDGGYSEMGLLGLAFHPDYKNNGRFFVYYSAPLKKQGVNHQAILAEYRVSDNNPDKAAMQENVILSVDQPESNHNGGQLAFDKEGLLYLGLGDGGGADDRHGETGNGQNNENLLGTIIRIDIDKSKPYTIPADNPFVGVNGRDEIYAYGLRNPWRFSFDRETGRLFCADVGQNKYEEVNIIEKGRNYGWRAMEGFHVFDEDLKEKIGNTALPIAEYEHAEGNSITGGYVYRGKQFPAMAGKYFFGDWSGKIFYLEEQAGNKWVRQTITFEG